MGKLKIDAMYRKNGVPFYVLLIIGPLGLALRTPILDPFSTGNRYVHHLRPLPTENRSVKYDIRAGIR